MNIVKFKTEPQIPPHIKHALPPRVERVHYTSQPEWAESLNSLGLRYPVRVIDSGLQTPSGFTPPIGPLPETPFAVARSKYGNLPIYRKVKNGGTRQLTVIRHLRGDVDAFYEDLLLVLRAATVPKASDQPVKLPNITRKEGGVLEIQGDYMASLVLWLKGLGF